MVREVKTLEDLRKAINQIPESQRDAWVDSFWRLFSQRISILVYFKD